MAVQFPSQIQAFNENALCEALQKDSLYCADAFLTQSECEGLRHELAGLSKNHLLHSAKIGRAEGVQQVSSIRGDQTLWLPSPQTPLGNEVLARIEAYKNLLNRELLLGLWDFEGHYALYPPGGHYERHLDRFGSDSRRTVSTILYLNPLDWEAERDGGALHLYTSLQTPEKNPDATISPLGGRIVWFLSSEVPHAVAPAHRERMSLTGWFRTR